MTTTPRSLHLSFHDPLLLGLDLSECLILLVHISCHREGNGSVDDYHQDDPTDHTYDDIKVLAHGRQLDYGVHASYWLYVQEVVLWGRRGGGE